MAEFRYDIVKNTEIFMENRLTAHSDHEYYSSKEAAEAGVSDIKYSLNGIWRFAYARNYELAPREFWKNESDTRKWDTIRVPAHIQMEGYGHPQYANVQYPWDGYENICPGEIPESFNPVASYVKYFYIPSFMKGKRVFVSFQGAESGLALWLNGHYIGYAEDSFTPSEFELTEFIDPEGENKLSAQVFRFTAGSWCEDQDFFRFSGIFRDVYLYAIPDVHIRDLKIQTLLSEDYRDAVLSVDFDCIGDGRAELNLYDGDEVIARVKAALTGGTAHVSIPVAAPKKWSAEKPNLYRLENEIREYMVACYGTTEYTENMTGITLGAVDEAGCRQYIDYEYKCRDLSMPGAECVSASVPQIKTKVSMHSFGGAVGIVREGYAFSPMFTLGYNKNVRNGEVFTTWLRLEREN